MNTIQIADINGAFSVSLWDLSLGVIVLGTIMNLFINFTLPTLPDKWEGGVTKRAYKNSVGKHLDFKRYSSDIEIDV